MANYELINSIFESYDWNEMFDNKSVIYSTQLFYRIVYSVISNQVSLKVSKINNRKPWSNNDLIILRINETKRIRSLNSPYTVNLVSMVDGSKLRASGGIQSKKNGITFPWKNFEIIPYGISVYLEYIKKKNKQYIQNIVF